uniref:DUF5009 domain-containing protein n=1 Tax=Alistipes sp. TaxID=1872444 RepID=UPI0040569BB0
MKRVAAIDFLRALAIIGMVVSGQMLWHAELPAFMFHAQLPPPTFAFNPSVAGITWVDLVFPFFLFSMGAAMPLALRRREEKGATWWQITQSALHRFVWLAAFAIILGNTRMGRLSELAPWAASLITLGVWGLFFAMFARIPNMERRRNTILNWAGFVALIAATLLYKPLFGVGVSLHQSDIIILILASMALFGTLVWWATRNSLVMRVVVIAAVALLKMASSVEGSWCQWLWQQTPADWLFLFEYQKYLCLVLSGTIAGDVIHRALQEQSNNVAEEKSSGWLSGILVGVMCALIITLLCGLFSREVGLTVLLSTGLCGLAGLILKGMKGEEKRLLKELFIIAVVLLAIGLIAEPLEGGIKKDHATTSFYFTTGAMALFVLIAALTLEIRFGIRFRLLEACGANPMFAYTASGYLLTPLLTLTGLIVWVEQFAALGPWCSFLRGVLFALMVIGVTYPFTRKNYYWKS